VTLTALILFLISDRKKDAPSPPRSGENRIHTPPAIETTAMAEKPADIEKATSQNEVATKPPTKASTLQVRCMKVSTTQSVPGWVNVELQCMLTDPGRSPDIVGIITPGKIISASIQSPTAPKYPANNGFADRSFGLTGRSLFNLYLQVPADCQEIERVEAQLELIREPAWTQVRWENPLESIGQSRVEGGYRFTLLDADRSNPGQITFSLLKELPTTLPTDPAEWPAAFLEACVLLPDGTRGERLVASGSRLIARFNAPYQTPPAALELRFVSALKFGSLPFELAQMSIPKPASEPSNEIAAPINERHESAGHVFKLDKIQVRQSGKNAVLSAEIEVSWPAVKPEDRNPVLERWNAPHLEASAIELEGKAVRGRVPRQFAQASGVARGMVRAEFQLEPPLPSKLSKLNGAFLVYKVDQWAQTEIQLSALAPAPGPFVLTQWQELGNALVVRWELDVSVVPVEFRNTLDAIKLLLTTDSGRMWSFTENTVSIRNGRWRGFSVVNGINGKPLNIRAQWPSHCLTERIPITFENVPLP